MSSEVEAPESGAPRVVPLPVVPASEAGGVPPLPEESGLGSRIGVASRLLPVTGWRMLNSIRDSRLHLSLEAPLFREVQLEMTIVCNLRCPFCWWWGTNGVAPGIIRNKEPLWKDQLTLEQIKTIFAPLQGTGVHAYLSGGEPFDRPDAMEIIEYISSLGLTISFTTNGTLLTDEIIDRLVKVDGITVIHFSLDGPPDIHDSIRGKGNFAKTTENAQKILARRKNGHPKVWANSVMTNAMFGRTLDFVRSVKALGFEATKSPYHPTVYSVTRITSSSKRLTPRRIWTERYNFAVLSSRFFGALLCLP